MACVWHCHIKTRPQETMLGVHDPAKV
jgi:hypothetical protein